MIKNQWYAIASSKEIKKNQLFSLKRLNMNLVLFRDNHNNINALIDKCSHRGAALSKGKVQNNCIQCPFHGLEFNGDGNCEKIPALGNFSKDNLKRFNIQNFLVKEQNEIIYIWYGNNKVSSEIPFFEELKDDNFSMKEMTDIWNTHYSRAIENQLDVIHLPFIHHNTIGRGNKTLVNGPKTIIIENKTIITSANNEVDNGQKPLSPKESKIKNTFLKFNFPNIWLNHVSDNILIFIFFAPIDDENTKLYIRFYNKITNFKFINSFISIIGKYMNNIVQKQDKRVVITQNPKKSELKIKENLLQGDLPIIEYRKIRDCLQKGGFYG